MARDTAGEVFSSCVTPSTCSGCELPLLSTSMNVQEAFTAALTTLLSLKDLQSLSLPLSGRPAQSLRATVLGLFSLCPFTVSEAFQMTRSRPYPWAHSLSPFGQLTGNLRLYMSENHYLLINPTSSSSLFQLGAPAFGGPK